MTILWQDLRYAARTLRRSPGFALIAITVLAIGIGANSAIFSLVDAALLRPLPFHDPGRLTVLWEHPPAGRAHNRVAPLNFLEWSEQNHVFSSLAAVSGGGGALITPSGSAERIRGQSVSVTFFDLLGVSPILGRTFTEDDQRQKAKVLVMSERLWRDRYGADPKVIGRSIILGAEPFTIIGVVPAQFQLFYESEIWTPFIPKRSPEQRKMHYLQVIGRLKPGVTIDQARAGMNLVAAGIARIAPDANKDWTVTVEPLRQGIVGPELRVTSLVLAGVTGFVLLVACANIANLLLARAAGRTREIAVRVSLGAGRARVIRQLLTESLLLFILGGAAGVALAWFIVRAAPSFLPPDTLPLGLTLSIDARVTGFAAAIAIFTGLLFGFAPAWQASRISLAAILHAGGRTNTGGVGAFRNTLAAVEIAVAVMLVAGAGLLVRTLITLSHVDPGFRAESVLTMYASLPLKHYPQPANALQFYEAAERELAALAGVRSVGLGTSLPLDGWEIGMGFQVLGDPDPGESRQHAAHYQMINSNYFATLGIPVARGRAFTDRDNAASEPICIVNEEFARRYLKGKDAIGVRMSVQSMDPAGPKPVVRQVVGVMRQVKVLGIGESEPTPEIYVPLKQNAWYTVSFAVRVAGGDPLAFAPAVKSAIARVDKELPLTRVRSMEQVASETVAQPRFRAGLVGAFAVLALVLSAVGIFGVLAFMVSQRTRELGIRIALGAQRADVLRLVLGSGFKITLAGIGAGILGAAALTRSLSSLLYGVQAMDPLTFTVAPAMLGLIALIACAVPAIRASRVDPAVALREE